MSSEDGECDAISYRTSNQKGAFVSKKTCGFMSCHLLKYDSSQKKKTKHYYVMVQPGHLFACNEHTYFAT
jgi:hypothetical protein